MWTSSLWEWEVGKKYLNCNSALTMYSSLSFHHSPPSFIYRALYLYCVDKIVLVSHSTLHPCQIYNLQPFSLYFSLLIYFISPSLRLTLQKTSYSVSVVNNKVTQESYIFSRSGVRKQSFPIEQVQPGLNSRNTDTHSAHVEKKVL